ncbi:MAG: sulfotransferase family protein [Cyanobacteriota bacterium]
MLFHRLKRLFELLIPLDGFMLHCRYHFGSAIRASHARSCPQASHGSTFGTIYLFVCGPPRSGTTLLINSLMRHPSIAAFLDETNFFSLANPLRSRFTPLSSDGSREILYCSHTKGEAYSRLADAIRSITHKQVVAEKTPQHCFVLDQIKKEVPDAHYLFIIRDPFASVASMIANKDFIPQGLNAATATRYWIKSVQALLDFQRTNQDVVLLLKYEDLCADPAVTAAQICRYLGLNSYDLFQPACEKPLQQKHTFSGRRGFEKINDSPVLMRQTPARDALSLPELATVEHLLSESGILYAEI